MMLLGEAAIDLIFVVAVVVAVACLAHLLSLTVREHRELSAVPARQADRAETVAVSQAATVIRLRPSVARHRHVVSSG